VTERGPLRFTFDGRPYSAREGDSVAAALFAGGVRVFTRSFKYHRPRGLLCCAGRCANCLVNVDGRPNVRACMTPARAGMRVRHQNAWPSLQFDLMAVADHCERWLPVGWYYKAFVRPRAAWPVAAWLIRHAAGLGVVQRGSPPADYRHEYRTTDVAVVGGGPAGLAAARAAARAGRRVTLVDEQDAPGGALRAGWRQDLVDRLAAAAIAAGVTIWTGATAFGAYEGRQLGVQREESLVELRYRRLVLATGAYERPAVFAGNDLPGIMLGTGAERLLRRYGLPPGRQAVVATCHDGGLTLAAELRAAGIAVAAVGDTRDGSRVVAARGGRHLRAVILTRPGEAPREVECDLLCLSLGWEPAMALLAQAGLGPPRWDASRSVYCAGEGEEEILLAGCVTGAASTEACLALGETAGLAAAGAAAARLDPPASYPEDPLLFDSPARVKRFVCLCEDVTDKDVRQAVAEGFDHVETLKRYATPSMGPCQGKMCRTAVGAALARCVECAPAAVGVSRARPPAGPVLLGALAAGHAAPVRRTAMHARHAALGARMVNLGEWKRPEVYSSVEEECRAVRERAGLIDVGTLGKLEVFGPDAAALLERVYTIRVRDLAPGRLRYAVACDDAGIILDDGTVTRLAEERWFLTTTTSGVEAMDQGLRWAALPAPGGGPQRALVNNVTAGLAAMNLAGPRARAILSGLTDLDLSPAAFPYLGAREARVAGVAARLLRVGFVGEVGYEIHCPAEHGQHVWDAILEAGREVGLLPFGVEAQRVLRLEKGHPIVGHDTDALSNPVDAGMAWVVKWDKPEFTGRRALQRARAVSGPQRLVGFTLEDGSALPPEGSAILHAGRPAGRVTSCRWSPTLGRGIGLAWVPAAVALEGAPIEMGGLMGIVPAVVTLQPFYDPEGVRVRG
jgi:sarcosine oxidase subunit alpha